MDNNDQSPKDPPSPAARNITPEAVQGVLNKLDKDLACLAVFSALSLKPSVVLESLVTASDLMYFREMVKVMSLPIDPDMPNNPEKIRTLLKADGWIC